MADLKDTLEEETLNNVGRSNIVSWTIAILTGIFFIVIISLSVMVSM